MIPPMWQGWDQQRMAEHQRWLRSMMPQGPPFGSGSGDPDSHHSETSAAHAAAMAQMHEQHRTQMQHGAYAAGAYPYAAFVQYNMV